MSTAAPTTVTTSGPVQGRPPGADGVASFLGIPYAAPPVGPRRLRPPVPHPGWTEPLDATRFGPAALQPSSILAQTRYGEDEDCLTLNVWTPGCDDARRPVMVWFHGGGFTTGTGSIGWYDGARLAARGAVVVTVNYRLGALGFLHLEPLGGDAFAGSGNCGLADQALAVDWVRANAEAFGGDPERVCLFGESAGGMSVTTHLALPGAADRFRRGIAQSGAAYVHTAADGERVARAVLGALDIDPAHPERILDVDARAVIDAQAAAIAPEGQFLPLPFRPTVDGTSLPAHPIDAVAAGSSRGVDLLVGSTLDEMRLFALMGQVTGEGATSWDADEDRLLRRIGRALDRDGRGGDAGGSDPAAVAATYRRRLGADASPRDVLIAMGTDLVFRNPALRLAEAHATHSATFSYVFAHASDAFDGALGAAHAVDVPFAFDNLHQYGTEFLVGEIHDGRRRLAGAMADAWVAFAATGDPSTDTMAWPAFDPDRRATAWLDVDPRVIDDPLGDERRIWQP